MLFSRLFSSISKVLVCNDVTGLPGKVMNLDIPVAGTDTGIEAKKMTNGPKII